MNDLISRQAAIDALNSELTITGRTNAEAVMGYVRLVKDRLERLPSAEPKKGKWNFIGDNMFECSMCGVLYTTEQLNSLRNYDTDHYLPWFCPHCGADMRGEQNG